MLEAIDFGSMLQSIEDSDLSVDTIGILLARPKSDTGKSIADSLPYYHHRSGININFYLPGYGAYWYGRYPDETDLIKIEGVQWSFSYKEYTNFVASIEEHSQWKYSGESELLLTEYRNKSLDFSKVLRFRLDAMLRDGVIPSVDAFFECLFREISKGRGLTQVSSKAGVKTIGLVALECLMDALPNFFGGIIQKGKHYIVHDYSDLAQ